MSATTKLVKNSYLSEVELIAPPIRTKTFTAIKDSGLSKQNAWMNFGDIGSMSLASETPRDRASVIDFSGFDEFNEESLRSRIFDVKLVIGLFNNNYAHKLDTYEFKDHDWFEYSVTWFYAHVRDDAFIGDKISEDITLPKNKQVEIDITDYFIKQMIKKNNNLGFYITSDAASQSSLLGKTKESGTPPKIVVRYYDIPHAGKGITFPPGKVNFNKFGAAVAIPDPEDAHTWNDFEVDGNQFYIDSSVRNYFIPDGPNDALNQFRVSAFSAMKVDFIDKDGNTSRTINTDEDIDIDTIPKLTVNTDTYGSISTGDIIKNKFTVHIGVPDSVIDGSFIVSVFSAANVKFFNKAKAVVHKMFVDEDEFDIGNIPNYYAENDTDSTESDFDISNDTFDVHASARGDIDGNKFYWVKDASVIDIGTVDKPNQFTVSSGVFDYSVISVNNSLYYKGQDPTELSRYGTIKYDTNGKMIGFDKYEYKPGAFVKGIDSDGDVGTVNIPDQFHVYNSIYGTYNPAYATYEKNKLSTIIDYDPNGMPEISNNKFNVWKGSAFKYNFFDKADAKIKDANNTEVSDIIEVDDIATYSNDTNTSTILSTGDIPALATPQRDSDNNLTGNGAFNIIPLKRTELDKNRMFIVEGDFAEQFPKNDYDNNSFDVHAAADIPDINGNQFDVDNDYCIRYFIGKPFTTAEKNNPPYNMTYDANNNPIGGLCFREGIDTEINTTDDYSFDIKARSVADIDANTFIVKAHYDRDINSRFFVAKSDPPKDINDNKFQPKWSVPIEDIEGNQFYVEALIKRTAPVQFNKFYKFFVVSGNTFVDVNDNKFQPKWSVPIDIDGNKFGVAVVIPDPKKPRPEDPNFFVEANQFGAAVITKPYDIDGNTLKLAFKFQFWYGHPSDPNFTHVFRVPFVAPPVDLDDSKFKVVARTRFYIDKNKFQVRNNADSKSYGFIVN